MHSDQCAFLDNMLGMPVSIVLKSTIKEHHLRRRCSCWRAGCAACGGALPLARRQITTTTTRTARCQAGGTSECGCRVPVSADVGQLLRLEVVLQDGEGLRLLAPLAHDDARAADDLAGGTLLVELGEADPLAELLLVRHLHQVDPVLRAQRLDELGVLGLRAVGREDAQLRLALVERLGALVQAAGDAVVHQRVLQHQLERRLDVHHRRRLGDRGRLGDLNLRRLLVSHLSSLLSSRACAGGGAGATS
mmetsp:Transcript_10707/g.35475  ORF Transcript_10707/g.35475 Transcript_10707/m.35475 type:complete len:249 (-) Transcript_10707:63-809(-)